MRRVLAGLAVLLLVIGVTACGEARPAPEAEQEETASRESGAGTDDVAGTSRQVLVLGRSVMTDWMDHWGADASGTASLDGNSVTFREIEGPPGIARSAADAIASAPAGSTVVFKFGFVDFNGGEYDDELDALMEYVAIVADAADAAGTRLILGTALPRVEGETTQALLREHREFGRRIAEFAAERRDAGQAVMVLDLNAALADAEGALERGYAVSPDDSHLNDAAYDVLDTMLLKTLDDLD
ncbi:MAG TPA: hypothetical protein DCP20_06495 [Coriobacteriia bacterium]|nr:hypothetical protein [Coriobacteriia bacterium]